MNSHQRRKHFRKVKRDFPIGCKITAPWYSYLQDKELLVVGYASYGYKSSITRLKINSIGSSVRIVECKRID